MTNIYDLLAERERTYGNYDDNANRIISIFNLISAPNDFRHPVVFYSKFMLAVKLARLYQTPEHLDSILDVAGYAIKYHDYIVAALTEPPMETFYDNSQPHHPDHRSHYHAEDATKYRPRSDSGSL